MKNWIFVTMTALAFALPACADNDRSATKNAHNSTSDTAGTVAPTNPNNGGTNRPTDGSTVGSALEDAKNSTKEAYQDTAKNVKKAYRAAKDKNCEMVNGKLECGVQKAANQIRNATDEAKDKLNDTSKTQ